jgi:hypothetical protein
MAAARSVIENLARAAGARAAFGYACPLGVFAAPSAGQPYRKSHKHARVGCSGAVRGARPTGSGLR